MSEKPIPFDFEAFKADPSRLRYDDGSRPDWAEPVRDCIAVRRDFCYTLYQPSYHCQFRLAANTRIVRVRLYRITGTRAISVATNLTGANLDAPGVYPWISDPVEIEVTE